MSKTDLPSWLLESDEPWTRYRTLVDLLDRPEDDPEVQATRAEMLAHSQVQALVARAAAWPGYPLKRHNDANHPLYKFSTLADFGLRVDDPDMAAGIEAVAFDRGEYKYHGRIAALADAAREAGLKL